MAFVNYRGNKGWAYNSTSRDMDDAESVGFFSVEGVISNASNDSSHGDQNITYNTRNSGAESDYTCLDLVNDEMGLYIGMKNPRRRLKGASSKRIHWIFSVIVVVTLLNTSLWGGIRTKFLLIFGNRNTNINFNALDPIGYQEVVDENWHAPNFLNLYSFYNDTTTEKETVLPVFWWIPCSGGRTVVEIMSYCLNFVIASDMGMGYDDASLQVIGTGDLIAPHYVNVDTTTLSGLQRAKQLSLVESHMADVIVTPKPSDASTLFDNNYNTGRVFVMMRHPVKRAVSQYYASLALPKGHPHFHARLQKLTINQYVHSDFVQLNTLTKTLTNLTVNAVVDENHLKVAKQVLNDYVAIGIMEWFDESIERLVGYFGWEDLVDLEQFRLCQASFSAGRNKKTEHPHLAPETLEFATLWERNWADVELYQYARKKFKLSQEKKMASLIPQHRAGPDEPQGQLRPEINQEQQEGQKRATMQQQGKQEQGITSQEGSIPLQDQEHEQQQVKGEQQPQ